MNGVDSAKQLRQAIELIINRLSSLDDSERLRIAELHTKWKQGAGYGTNEYLQYGQNVQGKAGLYRTTRNIASAATPPDQPSNPQQYALVGYSTFNG